MEIKGFTQSDFDIFTIPSLDGRMKAIQEQIQPKFKAIGTELTDELSVLLGNEMYLHIAKHARRTVNPPKDTWLAIGPNKRGYKKYPHFQLGLFDDHLFIWLAYIYELPNKVLIGENLLNQIEDIRTMIPEDFVISVDHMQKNAQNVNDIDLEKVLNRFKNVKKAELLIGRNIKKDDPILTDASALTKLALDTYKTLLPIYRTSYTLQS